MKHTVESWLHEILDLLEEEELLAQEILLENSFQDMYGKDMNSVLSSNLFQDTNYTTFENKDLRLLFLNLYLRKIKEEWEYITFLDFVEKWEKGNSCQKHVNAAKISLALELPDVIQGNKILRERK